MDSSRRTRTDGGSIAKGCTRLQSPVEQRGFGNYGTDAPRPRQSDHGDDQINEQDDEVAHLGNRNNSSQAAVFRPIWQFAKDGPKVPRYYIMRDSVVVAKLIGAIDVIGKFLCPLERKMRERT